MVKFSVSERFACKVLGQHRSTQRKKPQSRPDEEALTTDIIRLASRYGRYGYRRITAMLRSEGWTVNAKRVERIWRREGLKVPQKQPKRGRLWLNDGSCVRLRPEHPNHVWSYDFVEGRTHNGRKFRMLNIIDEFTRECLAIRIDRKLNSPTSSTSCRTCSSYAACPATFVLITGRSSSPRQCESGLQLSAPRPRSSSPEALGRTATARASTRSFATNCSTVRSSTASPRPRSSSRHGGATTTPSDHTHRSDINRRRQRPSPGLQSQPDRFRQQRKQWPKSRLCIKTESGPPHRGRPM